mgnify:CR=1 FL=1|jgi:hypothetical protein
MSALTKNERDGLDDVFLSIHSHTNRYNKIKEISALIMIRNNSINPLTLLKRAKKGLKETKLLHFIAKLSKKKKNLSK